MGLIWVFALLTFLENGVEVGELFEVGERWHVIRIRDGCFELGLESGFDLGLFEDPEANDRGGARRGLDAGEGDAHAVVFPVRRGKG
jgi:hypothetical protein